MRARKRRLPLPVRDRKAVMPDAWFDGGDELDPDFSADDWVSRLEAARIPIGD